MDPEIFPLRQPKAWTDARTKELLQPTPITLFEPQKLPPEVTVIKGLWPGIRVTQGGGDRAAAGPTGEAWVDSNGWRIRLAQARGAHYVWVDADPQASRTSVQDYIVAFADAAAHGGRWIISLDDELAAQIAVKKPEAMTTWKQIVDAVTFFAFKLNRSETEAVIGVLSTFDGPKRVFSEEVINNLARTKQQYRPFVPNRIGLGPGSPLKAMIYTDGAELDANIRKGILDWVNWGGMLITSAAWGSLPNGTPIGNHPRFALRKVGYGSIALATGSFADPYRVANDAVVLVSHRQDVVRFFNSGAITPCFYKSDRRAVLDTTFYSLRPVEDTSVWVKGSWRTARLRLWPNQPSQPAKLEVRDAGVEVHLPAVSQYVRVELDA